MKLLIICFTAAFLCIGNRALGQMPILPGMNSEAASASLLAPVSKRAGAITGEAMLMHRKALVQVISSGDKVNSVLYMWDKATAEDPIYDVFVDLRNYLVTLGGEKTVAMRLGGLVLVGDQGMLGSYTGDILVLQTEHESIVYRLTLVAPSLIKAKEASYLTLDIMRSSSPVPTGKPTVSDSPPAHFLNPNGPIDRPIYFGSAEELFMFTKSPDCRAIHPQLAEALTFLFLHAYPGSKERKTDDELLIYVNGETPRRLMIWSYTMQINWSELGAMEDELHISKREPLRTGEKFEDAEKLYHLRISESRGWKHYCEERISELRLPNHPSPGAVH